MIQVKNVMEAWKKGVKFIKENGVLFQDDEERECHEVNNFIITIQDVSDALQALHWIRAQADWYYPTDEELHDAMLGKNNQQTDRYVYGERIFAFNQKVNQIDGYIIPLLQKQPTTRRALVVLANPAVDYTVRKKNFISMISLWFRISEGKLCVTIVVRSSDYILGWPANVYQAMLLQKYVAQKLHIPIGSITTNSLSAHYFTEDEWILEKLEK